MSDGDGNAGNHGAAQTARVELARTPDFQLASMQVRPSMREVEINGGREQLEPRVMQVLVALARARGGVVSRDDLIESCWDGRIVGDDSIQRCLVRLRKLAEASEGAFQIETVTRVGYRLVVTDETPAPAAPPAHGARRMRGVAIAAAGLAFVAAVVWLLVKPGAGDLKVAVTPFTVETSDPAARGLAQDLPETTIAALASIQAPTLSRAAAAGPRHGGARLLVGGDVSGRGAGLKVRFRVDDARSGLTLWSGDLTRADADTAALADQAAARIAEVVGRTVHAFTVENVPADGPALGAYMKTIDVISGGGAEGGELIAIERDLLKHAPRLSRAHSGYAVDLVTASFAQPSPLRERLRAEASAEAATARRLDPHNWEAGLPAYQLTPPTDWQGAEAALLEAQAMEPQNGIAVSFLGSLMRGTGRTAAGLELHRQAVRLAPTTPPLAGPYIEAAFTAGRLQEAAAAVVRARRLWPERAPVRRAALDYALLYGPVDHASAALDEYQASGPKLEPAHEAAWRAFIEDRRAGRLRPATARALSAAVAPNWAEGAPAVLALSLLGEVDHALALAERIADARPGRARFGLLYGPAARPMLRDRRFMRFASRVGLGSYWQATGHWPDFCAWPDLPYDCKAEAARAAVTRRAAAS